MSYFLNMWLYYLFIYLCIINHPQNLVVKNTSKQVFSLTVPVCQGFRSGLAEQCWLRFLMRLQVRCWPDLQSSEGLTGAGGPASEMAHSHGWTSGAICGQDASPSPHVGLNHIGFNQGHLGWGHHGVRLPPEQAIQERMPTKAIFFMT